mmetsp:Transcript_49965/g.125895  ORF Transcript_49965/g.125895 Transcript_49965/m.125895 type:complete len:222 (-) Transcript_49965:1544-2209(-)
MPTASCGTTEQGIGLAIFVAGALLYADADGIGIKDCGAFWYLFHSAVGRRRCCCGDIRMLCVPNLQQHVVEKVAHPRSGAALTAASAKLSLLLLLLLPSPLLPLPNVDDDTGPAGAPGRVGETAEEFVLIDTTWGLETSICWLLLPLSSLPTFIAVDATGPTGTAGAVGTVKAWDSSSETSSCMDMEIFWLPLPLLPPLPLPLRPPLSLPNPISVPVDTTG